MPAYLPSVNPDRLRSFAIGKISDTLLVLNKKDLTFYSPDLGFKKSTYLQLSGTLQTFYHFDKEMDRVYAYFQCCYLGFFDTQLNKIG